MQWDMFCRVIDNHGDVGVCWRLASDLASRGERVRLWIDVAEALRWMAPDGAPRVEVRPWPSAEVVDMLGDVVIEAFGCELPLQVVSRMAASSPSPIWINLEYLSAEGYVERAHRLPSPQFTVSGVGLRKWFFYPGFTPLTGGLIREQDLLERQRVFDAPAWLQLQGFQPREGEQVVSLFCYEQAALPALVDQLAQRPTLLLATVGQAEGQVEALLGPGLRRGALRAARMPALTQRAYDELLWASDLNFVRGEDSFVRAQWAGRPFVWQAYPQRDGAHRAKIEAFLDQFLVDTEPSLAASLRRSWGAWNDATLDWSVLPPPGPWAHQCVAWRDAQFARPDLSQQLIRFVAETR